VVTDPATGVCTIDTVTRSAGSAGSVFLREDASIMSATDDNRDFVGPPPPQPQPAAPRPEPRGVHCALCGTMLFRLPVTGPLGGPIVYVCGRCSPAYTWR
jgi:hypothetical protein